MALRKLLVALLVTGASLALAAPATAAWPDFSRCPTTAPRFLGCIHIQNRSGNLNIKGFNVPLGESLAIRGAIVDLGERRTGFVPATGTNGFIATPVPVPGGLLGIDFPIPGNSVLAITELAGPSSAIDIDFSRVSIRIPVKVRLVNVLLGMNCHIGTDSSPVILNLITGTTSPPPPNRPISGRLGTPVEAPPATFALRGSVNVENSFAVPGASRCGLGLGLINALVNLKLRLPSAAGNNSIEVVNDLGIRSGA